MKDRYVQKFFSMVNLQLLIENNYLEGVFGFLSFVFLITSIMDKDYDNIINLERVLAAQGKIDVKLPPQVYDSFASISNFGIERLGTHPLKNLNGFIREGSHSYDSIMNACSFGSCTYTKTNSN